MNEGEVIVDVDGSIDVTPLKTNPLRLLEGDDGAGERHVDVGEEGGTEAGSEGEVGETEGEEVVGNVRNVEDNCCGGCS